MLDDTSGSAELSKAVMAESKKINLQLDIARHQRPVLNVVGGAQANQAQLDAAARLPSGWSHVEVPATIPVPAVVKDERACSDGQASFRVVRLSPLPLSFCADKLTWIPPCLQLFTWRETSDNKKVLGSITISQVHWCAGAAAKTGTSFGYDLAWLSVSSRLLLHEKHADVD